VSIVGRGHYSIGRILLLLAVMILLPRARAYGQDYDAGLARAVYNAAFTFMAPRILDPVPVPQLAIWGMHGLTAIDPALDIDHTEQQLRLLRDGRPILTLPAPGLNDIPGWSQTVAVIGAAAFTASAPVRDAGTRGMVQSFFDEVFNHLDPYSRYEPPEEATESRDRRVGEAGPGLSIVAYHNGFAVRDIVLEGAASAAGMEPGDQILAVDGQPVRDQSREQVDRWLRGQAGDVVNVTWRDHAGRVHRADLTLADVPPESVFTHWIGGIPVIRITSFNAATSAHVTIALNQAQAAIQAGKRALSGVVLDMRGNRGGLLRESVETAALFLNAGVVAYTAGRDPAAARTLSVTGPPLLATTPVVVLVDGRTASAAEILTAALADHGRAVVVGSATLGKGLVQAIKPMPDGGALYVTWSRVLAPLHWPLQGLGVLPQICTSVGADDVAQEMNALEAGIAPLAGPVRQERASRLPLPAAHILALRGVCPAAEGREADLAVARWLIEHPNAYTTALIAPTGQ
jgi:carboxyl-terminal processing protease